MHPVENKKERNGEQLWLSLKKTKRKPSLISAADKVEIALHGRYVID
jgi:hypothetical protein